MASIRRQRTFSHIVGFDDCPFPRGHRGDVAIVGTVFSGLRLEGVLSGKVRRDGVNSTAELIRLTRGSRFFAHLQLIMLQGIAMAGFNVVDVPRLHAELGLPVLVVARGVPRREAMRKALLERIPGGVRKWALIEQLAEMEPLAGVHVQRAGISRDEAGRVIQSLTPHGKIPEPLRVAHLIAGGVTTGESSGRV